VCILEISKQQGFGTRKGKMMKETYYFEQLFDAGVEQEDVKTVLRQYLNAGAKVTLDWRRVSNDYDVYLCVSTIDDENELDVLGHVFGNEGIGDNAGFTDGKNGDRADESEPFERCENELLERFCVSRDELEEIYQPW
jgi:hypothetical protein